MLIERIVNELQLEVLTSCPLDKEAEGIYIGDLLSVVMSQAKKNQIWMTVQTHVNVIAIASLLELSAIIIVEEQEMDDETLKKANEENIVVLRSTLPAYELSVRIKPYIG